MNRYFATGILLTAFAAILILQVDQRGAQPFTADANIPLTVKFADQVKYPKPPGPMPNESFLIQRMWPYDTLSRPKRQASLEYAHRAKTRLGRSASLYSAITWTQAGPTNIPGRISDIDADPANPGTVYAGTAAGGVYKSTDTGKTWTPIFDEVGVPAIGDVQLDPNDANTIYVATGEVDPGFDSYEGLGLYRSTDGGATWASAGLENSRRIAQILVDPTNSSAIFAGVGGQHFGGGDTARGVYRTLDGGVTWDRKLFVSDTTACIDLVLFHNTGVLLAAMWERVRYVDQPTRLGGVTSGVYRSDDYGETWTEMGFFDGLPDENMVMGRIGLAADADGDTCYAMYADEDGVFYGLYRSGNQGLTWQQTLDIDLVNAPLNASWQGGWYFGQVRCAPSDPSRVYAMGLDVWRSNVAGDGFFYESSGIHVDHHAMWIHPTNPNFIYNGCDGGVNFTPNGGTTWFPRVNQPSTQFYAVEIDPHNTDRLYGGTQDNGTMRSIDTDPDTWEHILGGDGFYVVVDHTDSNVIYGESQNGWLNKQTTFDGFFFGARNGLNYNSHRHAWNTPVVMDPNDPLVLYYGSEIMHKTTDGAANWFDFSPDLTDGPHPRGNFGVVTTISPAATDPDVVYAGTDDGNVWVTQDAGSNWTQIDGALPDRWVTRVAADPNHENIVYVTISGYHSGEEMPHVFRSEDFGANWTAISGDLPDAPVNDIIPSPYDSLTLWIATDYGVYASEDLGASWLPLGDGLPLSPISDLDYDAASGVMIAGTHGRSIFRTSLPVPPTTCCDLAGDTDNSGSVNIADVTHLLGYIFSGGAAPECCEEGDADGAGSVNIGDATYLIARIFSGGASPACGPTGMSCSPN
ncbi:MAG TPA: glycosyl hydrolase [candidate division Zixibacteria bacterium]|nr:glycosyl hydrolase [candidate division Zixibacteria bacterium]